MTLLGLRDFVTVRPSRTSYIKYRLVDIILDIFNITVKMSQRPSRHVTFLAKAPCCPNYNYFQCRLLYQWKVYISAIMKSLYIHKRQNGLSLISQMSLR